MDAAKELHAAVEKLRQRPEHAAEVEKAMAWDWADREVYNPAVILDAFAGLGAKDWYRVDWRQAVERLWKAAAAVEPALGGALAAASLWKMTGHPPNAFKQALAQCPDALRASVAAALGQALLGEPFEHRKLAYAWLEEGPVQDLAPFLHGLGDSSKPVRESAFRVLKAAGERARGPAEALLAHDQPATRAGATELLGALGLAASVPALEAALKQEKSRKVLSQLQAALDRCRAGAVPTAQAPGAAAAKDMDAHLAAQKVKLPRGLDAARLPALRWRDGSAVSEGALGWILGRLAKLDPDAEDAELTQVLAELAPEGRPEFLAALEGTLGQKSANRRWLYLAQAYFASPADLEDLAKNLDHEATSGGSRYAFYGVEVLRRRASLPAIRWLYHWSQQARSAGLRDRADAALDALAAARGADREEMLDQVVPDLGFDARGRQPFPYGDRLLELVLTADSEISIHEGGKLLKALPAARKGDDAALLKQRSAAFSALKKEVKAALDLQRNRLEQALSAARTWTPQQWRWLFLDHPVLSVFGRNLVFEQQDGGAWRGFAVSPEGDLLDASAEPFALGEGPIRLAHPVDLCPEALDAWRKFAEDSGLKPPFPQLSRPVYPDEGATRLEAVAERFAGVDSQQVASALVREGWQRGGVEDAGMVYSLKRRFGLVTLTLTHAGYAVSGGYSLPIDGALGILLVRDEAPAKDLPPRLHSDLVHRLLRLVS